MREWLNNFEYRTNMNWDVFALAGISVLMVALITVSFESIKALLKNPITGLRSE